MQTFKEFIKEQEEDQEIQNNEQPTDSVSEEETSETEEDSKEDEIDQNKQEIKDIPFESKINILLNLIYNLGYFSAEFNSQDGENYIVVSGKFEANEKTTLKKMASEMNLNLKIEETEIDQKKFNTKLNLKNKINLDNFISDVQKYKPEEETIGPGNE